MLNKHWVILAALLATSIGGAVSIAKPAEAHNAGYCGHGTIVNPSVRIRYIRAANRQHRHWHLYYHDHKFGPDHYQWKQCPSH